MAITDTERREFLERHGWKANLSPEEKKKIEDYWGDDDDVEYAIEMGG